MPTYLSRSLWKNLEDGRIEPLRKGCAQCQGSGFTGRVGLFEIFEVDEDIRDLIMQRKPASFIRSTVIMKGMKTMFQDGPAKAFMGETTIEEVFRVAL